MMQVESSIAVLNTFKNYHQSCYLKFTYILKISQSTYSSVDENDRYIDSVLPKKQVIF